MSRRRPSDAERFVVAVECEFCDAPAGRWCRSHLSPSRTISRLHQVRYELAAYHRRKSYALLKDMTFDPATLRAIKAVERVDDVVGRR